MIDLSKEALNSFSYRREVCKRFSSVAPLRFTFDVIVNFIKSMLELLVFILPIKVVLILAAPKMPSIFDGLLPGITKSQWAGILTVMVVLVHLSVLLGDWYLRRSTETYAEKFSIEQKKGKFSNGDFLRSVYSGMVDARGSSLLVILLGVAIGVIFPEFLLVFLSLLCVAALLTVGVASTSEGFVSNFIQRPQRILGKLSGLLFIAAFCYLVSSFVLFPEPPPFLSALVSIILARRLLGAVNQKVMNLVWFQKKRSAITKLFYKGHSEDTGSRGTVRALIDNISRSELTSFAEQAMASMGVEGGTVETSRWIESPVSWVSFIECNLKGYQAEGSEIRAVLKVYESNKTKVANKELEIYPYLERAGIIPKFIGLADVGGYLVHAFEVGGGWRFTNDTVASDDIYRKTLQVEFDSDLLVEYWSEHPVLTDRVTRNLLSRMLLVADRDEEQLLEKFLTRLPQTLQMVESLPMRLVVPESTTRQFVIVDRNVFSLLEVGDWRIEPLGFSKKLKSTARELITLLGDQDMPDYERPADEFEFKVSLCSKIAMLEKSCRQGQLKGGITIVSEIMASDLLTEFYPGEQVENKIAHA